MKTCTMKGARDRSYNVKNFNNQVNAVDGAHMKGYKNKGQTTAWTIPTRIDSMVNVTHLKLPPYELARRQARDNAISAISLVT